MAYLVYLLKGVGGRGMVWDGMRWGEMGLDGLQGVLEWVGVAHTGVSSVLLRIAKVVERAFAELLLALAFAPCMRTCGVRARRGQAVRVGGWPRCVPCCRVVHAARA